MAQDAGNRLPVKIAAMYTGWIAPNQADRDLQADVVERMLDPLAAAHFTAFYAKFQGAGDVQFDLTDPEQFARVQLVADACAARDLALIAYTYHHPHHGRNPELHAQFPPLVMESGEIHEDRFALADWEYWRWTSDEVFQLARASLELPIAAVGIDIEVLLGAVPSFDDRAWADFAGERGLDATIPAPERGARVAEQGLRDEYREWYYARWDGIVERWCEELHAINPDVSICIMPAHENWILRPFMVHAATERAPAIIDHWGMYNGSGLTDELLEVQDRVKALNPHNRFTQWLRPDSYRPEDIRVQCYHTLLRTDGYCNWHIGMLLPPNPSVPEQWGPDVYWHAYAEANERALADIAAGREATIEFVPVEPLVAKLDLSAYEAEAIPQLAPVGDGTGEDEWIPTRELEQFLIYAEAGRPISATIRHLAGSARPLALQYAVIAPDGATLRNEAIGPGAEETFSVDAPAAGTYALYVTGGAGGQAWYGVNVHNPHFAFPFRSQGEDRARLFFVKSMGPRTFWLTRTDPEAEAALIVTAGSHQTISVQIADQEPVDILEGPQRFELPTSDEPVRVVIAAPADVPDGYYVQYVGMTVEGAVYPYLSVAPGRRLLPAE